MAIYHAIGIGEASVRKIVTSGSDEGSPYCGERLEKVPQNMWNLIDLTCGAGQRE